MSRRRLPLRARTGAPIACGFVAGAGSAAAAVAGFAQPPAVWQLLAAVTASTLAGLAAGMSRAEWGTSKKTDAQFAI